MSNLGLDPASLGAVKAWGCAPSVWDGEQRKDRATGYPIWEIECSSDLGRFPFRVAAQAPPLPLGVYDAGRPVHLQRPAVTGWGKSGPFLTATAIQAIAEKS
ncbi:hypothetical protein [Nocardioides caricicola]|uniref:Uncharacterized protein n=1 Tax=Nocardioides caricicola TaxID=634770 RepID=A0ABW0N8X2_9ACTN